MLFWKKCQWCFKRAVSHGYIHLSFNLTPTFSLYGNKVKHLTFINIKLKCVITISMFKAIVTSVKCIPLYIYISLVYFFSFLLPFQPEFPNLSFLLNFPFPSPLLFSPLFSSPLLHHSCYTWRATSTWPWTSVCQRCWRRTPWEWLWTRPATRAPGSTSSPSTSCAPWGTAWVERPPRDCFSRDYGALASRVKPSFLAHSLYCLFHFLQDKGEG